MFSLMPLASAAETPNLMNTLDKDKFVNAVSNDANTDNNTALSKEEIAKLQKWLQDKNLTNDNGLKLGSTGDKVKEIQTWLKENKFYTGDVDGVFGEGTEAAVKAFQKEVGLKEDGQVGEYTQMAMQMWDEYAANAVSAASRTTSSSSSSSKKTYATTTSKKTYTSNKKYSTYNNNGWGYINGMDCWAMSDSISGKYSSQGYQTRTLHAKTSFSNDHRWVEINDGSGWHAAPDYSNLPGIYNPTY
jgi:N-acetylmuramoyl-L-alanine amidase